jgi:GntR family transcriptional repressor for pyruvate dehydrogenase complex
MHRVVEDIRDKIIRGELQEGQKLSPQDKFAESLGISRGTLREAFHQLMLMGLIEMRQGDGTYIRSIAPSMFMNTLSPALLMDKSSASELLEARLYIESEVASLAAKNATREEIQELKKILGGMKQDLAGNNVEDFITKDVEFHILIAKCSQNRVLMKVVQTIRDILYQFIADFFTVMPHTIKNAIYYHTNILRAIERHDRVGAKKNMEAHIKSLIRKIKSRENQLSSLTNKGDRRGNSPPSSPGGRREG